MPDQTIAECRGELESIALTLASHRPNSMPADRRAAYEARATELKAALPALEAAQAAEIAAKLQAVKSKADGREKRSLVARDAIRYAAEADQLEADSVRLAAEAKDRRALSEAAKSEALKLEEAAKTASS